MPTTLSDFDVKVLWQRARDRLELVDTEPPVSMTEIDKLLSAIGQRPANQTVADWIKSAAGKPEFTNAIVSAVVVPFDNLREQFTPVVEFVRLAADDAGQEIPLPARSLEDDQGRFRLNVAKENDELVIQITSLGNASDDYAGVKVGLAAAGKEPIAVVTLDEDGDGTIRLVDTTDLRLLLLRPVIGTVQDI